jgi:hypothetical protein
MPPELHPGALAALRLKLKTYAPKPPAEPPAPAKRGRAPSRKAPATGANDSLQRRIAGDVARWLEGLARHQPDLRALPHLGLTVLPDELVEAVADRVLAWAGWLLALDEMRLHRQPFTIRWREARAQDDGTLPEIGADGELLIVCLDSCRVCNAPPKHTTWPARWPEFCGAACGLVWLKDNAEHIERWTDIEDELETAINDALDRGERIAKDAAAEEALELKDDWLGSDDNPLLEAMRRHYAEPHLDLETALWRMQQDILPKLR